MTPIFNLTEWGAAQASPWVPHNAALRALEAVGRGSVSDRDLAEPPAVCADGASYLVGVAATGLWVGYDGKMAVAVGVNAANGWIMLTVATPGMFLYVEDEALRIQFIDGDWATANLAPTWGDIGGAIGDQVDLTSALAAAGGNTGGGQTLNGVVSGLGISYIDDLDFEMSAGSLYLDGELIAAAAQTISLAAADGANPRIDVLYVDEAGSLGKITGTPAASPSQPSVDPTTQLYLTFVLVPAAATALGGISNVDIYREGTEWATATSGAGFTANSVNNPYAGTKCIEGTTVASGAYIQLTAGAPVSFDGDGNLTLRIRSKAAWNAKRWLTLQWYEGGVAKGSLVSLKSGSFGFDASVTGAYQFAVIPKALFQMPAGSQVDGLRITDVGGSIGFYIDELILQTTGEVTGGGGGQVSGISQTDADARYARRSQNLADLTSPADARNNIDVYSKAEVDAIGGGGGGGAPLDSPAFTGIPTAPTAAPGTNTTQLATAAFVQAAIAALIDAAPGTLDTLHELAAALGNDANFAATMATALAGKQPLDADLTAIAALATQALGRSLLTASAISDLRALGLQVQAVPRTVAGTNDTAVLSDAGGYIRFTNAAAISFTIPPSSSVAFPIGTVIEVEQAGAGALSFVAGSGVTLNSRSADLTLAGQYAVGFAKKVGADTWTVNGDL